MGNLQTLVCPTLRPDSSRAEPGSPGRLSVELSTLLATGLVAKELRDGCATGLLPVVDAPD